MLLPVAAGHNAARSTLLHRAAPDLALTADFDLRMPATLVIGSTLEAFGQPIGKNTPIEVFDLARVTTSLVGNYEVVGLGGEIFQHVVDGGGVLYPNAPAIGLNTGGAGITADRACEFYTDDVTDVCGFEAGSIGTLNPGATDSFAVLVVFRLFRLPPSGTRYQLVGNKPLEGAGSCGITIYLDEDGNLIGECGDAIGTFVSFSQPLVDGAGNLDRGWHYACVRLERTKGEVDFFADTLTDNAAQVFDTLGDDASTWQISGGRGAGMYAARAQIRVVAFWTAAEAEALAGADLAAWWSMARLRGSPALTHARAVEVGDVAGGHPQIGRAFAWWAAGQPAYAQRAQVMPGAGLGLLYAPAGVVNLASATYASSSGTITKIVEDPKLGPDGFMRAHRLSLSLPGAYVYDSIALTNAGKYNHSVCLWAATPTTVQFQLRNSGGTLLASQDVEIGPGWDRYDHRITAPATATHRIGIAIPTSATVWFFHPQVGSGSMAPMVAPGVTTVATTLTNTTAGLVVPEEGAIDLEFAADRAGGIVIDVDDGATEKDRRRVALVPYVEAQAKDSAGVALTSATGEIPSGAIEARMRWRGAGLPAQDCALQLRYNASDTGQAVVVDGEPSPFTFDGPTILDRLAIGGATAGGSELAGIVRRVRIYKRAL